MAIVVAVLVCCCFVMFVRADLTLDDTAKQQIVDIHNEFRRTQGGSKMYQLVWDDELETKAKATVDGCVFKHSDYHAENIAAIYGFSSKSGLEGFGKTNIINILVRDGMPQYGMKSWAQEKDNIKSIDPFECQSGKVCGHYTQMVKDTAHKFGCAAKYCETIDMYGQKQKNGWFLSCDYDKGNMVGEPAFVEGTACSSCDKGDSCKNKLCVVA